MSSKYFMVWKNKQDQASKLLNTPTTVEKKNLFEEGVRSREQCKRNPLLKFSSTIGRQSSDEEHTRNFSNNRSLRERSAVREANPVKRLKRAPQWKSDITNDFMRLINTRIPENKEFCNEEHFIDILEGIREYLNEHYKENFTFDDVIDKWKELKGNGSRHAIIIPNQALKSNPQDDPPTCSTNNQRKGPMLGNRNMTERSLLMNTSAPQFNDIWKTQESIEGDSVESNPPSVTPVNAATATSAPAATNTSKFTSTMSRLFHPFSSNNASERPESLEGNQGNEDPENLEETFNTAIEASHRSEPNDVDPEENTENVMKVNFSGFTIGQHFPFCLDLAQELNSLEPIEALFVKQHVYELLREILTNR